MENNPPTESSPTPKANSNTTNGSVEQQAGNKSSTHRVPSSNGHVPQDGAADDTKQAQVQRFIASPLNCKLFVQKISGNDVVVQQHPNVIEASVHLLLP